MPNYKESAVSGVQWQRSHQVVVDNPLGGVPFITFQEEIVQDLNGVIQHIQVQGLRLDFDPAASIPLINPVDDTSLGTTATHGQLQVILYSLYKQLAAQRDSG